MIDSPPEYPALRPDLEIVAQAAPGRPGRHLVRDPVRNAVYEFTPQDIFLARRLDGHTDPETVRRLFREQFGHALRPDQFAAFIRQLWEARLLVQAPPDSPAGRWQQMRPLPVDADRLFRTLSRVFRWAYTWPAYGAAAVLIAIGLRLIAGAADIIWQRLSNLFFYLSWAGASGAFGWGDLLQIAFFIIVLPVFRETAKGTTCRHYGCSVGGIRYTWHLRCIPRMVVDISGLMRAERAQQIHIAAAGLLFELLVVCGAVLAAEVLSVANPLHTLCQHLAVAAAIRFVLNANPFGKLDGCLLTMLWLDVPRLRERALDMFHAWLCLRPMPEPASPARRAGLILYGLLADATSLAIDLAIVGLVGYVLIAQLDGTGAVLFLIFLGLKYETQLRNAIVSISAPWAVPAWKRYARWIWPVLLVALILAMVFVPYTLRAVGDFRVQPLVKHEARAAVTALIEAVPVAEGSAIRAGDVLIRLSSRDIEQDLDLQRAALKRERARLQELQAGATPEELERARQRVVVAGTALGHSEKTLQRAAALFAKQHIPEEEYDRALRQRDLDRENLALARSELALIEAGERAETIDAQRAEVERLTATVAHLEDDLTRTVLRSPIDGFLTTLYIQGRVGERAEAGKVLAVVQDSSTARLRIAVPQAHTRGLKPGAEVVARAWAYPDRVFTGAVHAVLPVAIEKKDDLIQEAKVDQDGNVFRNLDTPPEHVVPVLVDIPNTNGLLKTDMTGFAKITLRRTSLGYALLRPVIDFFRVRVWSWLP
jgi:putative peptide zinc metalloprotease protein